MGIIETQCWIQKPVGGYYKDCLAIFGIEYQTWLALILSSLIIGFLVYYIYSLIKKTKSNTKKFILISLAISLITLIILLVIRAWTESQIII